MTLILNLGVSRSGFIVGQEVTNGKWAIGLHLHHHESDKTM
jgi:hypothetical protein